MIKLNHTGIESYVGDVFPLKLSSDMYSLAADGVKWEVSGDAVTVRSFESDPELPFCDAVMVSIHKVGEASVIAHHRGKRYVCHIKARERKSFPSDYPHNYYRGDLHTHTTRLHDHYKFIQRSEGFQADQVNFIKKQNLLDFGVMSDHSVVMGYGFEFMRAHLTEEALRPMGPVMFPGSESGMTSIEEDRFGFRRNYGGELVVINADNHVDAFCWNDFTKAFATSSEPVLIFAHPQSESVKYSNWNFRFEEIRKIPELLKMARFMEMGNGIAIKANVLHEYAFSRALDAGFRITTSCGSDGHGIWGYLICPGKTILMAPEKTREAFVDAMRECRGYASESANVKVRLSVNGLTAPADIPLTNEYKFILELDYFEDIPDNEITALQVVSDGGEWIYEKEVVGRKAEFTIRSDTARYFYLRLQDTLGRRTWSPPVWCSRPFDEYTPPKERKVIDSADFTAIDDLGESADKVVHGDHSDTYERKDKHPTITIDMHKTHNISAIGYATPRLVRTAPTAHGECVISHVKYPRIIRVSTSLDGKNYTEAFTRGIRTYSGEEIFDFDRRDARFVRLEVLTTVGEQYARPEYKDEGSILGVCSVFSDTQDTN